jgi:hypothetical protein
MLHHGRGVPRAVTLRKITKMCEQEAVAERRQVG